jgi:hypothetical protein
VHLGLLGVAAEELMVHQVIQLASQVEARPGPALVALDLPPVPLLHPDLSQSWELLLS